MTTLGERHPQIAIETRKVEPIGSHATPAFVECADRSKSGLRMVDWPEYPPSRGDELRAARRAAGLGLREAATRAGLTPTQWSEIECGARVPLDWSLVFKVVTGS